MVNNNDCYILGISAFYHDSAACLVKNGAIVAAAQEERFTRKKHDPSFPENSISWCFKYGGITSCELSAVIFYDKPFLKFERILQSYLACAPRGLASFIQAMPVWLKSKLWLKDLLRRKLDCKGPILFAEHHESHAASAFFASPFNEAAILTVDGVGEWASTSCGAGIGNQINLSAEIDFPHSLGLLYSAFTYYAGFKVNSGEYKLMGLAPYGEPVYKQLILNKLIDLKEDGSFKLNMDYFNYVCGLTMINKKFNRLLGAMPRKPESPLSQHYMDVACSIQQVTEEVILRMSRHLYRQTKSPNLCLAGGVALNCVANGRILREGPFKNIWVQPAAGDAGGALGAALLCWYHYFGNQRFASGSHDFQYGTYLGPEYSDEYIGNYLINNNIEYISLSVEEIPERIAELINAQKVVGWFQGRMEFGPRALGSRSILADARSLKMQEMMNLKIKFRESFRPFAPAVAAQRVADFFELNTESPYMLLTAPIKKELRRFSADEENLTGLARLSARRSIFPAITHVDYSARIQSVTEKSNPLFYRLLKKMDEKYGCPVVINTSFNIRGEPIVCSPQDAYRCFVHTNMDYLLLGRFLIEKKEQKPLDKDIEYLKNYELD